LFAQSVGVIALVAIDHVALGQAVDKRRAGRAVGDVPAGDQERERAAVFVRQRMDLGGSAATGTADRLIFLPPFPPAAERWAFTAEESIISCSFGPPERASASNRPTHTPLSAHRTKRL